MQHGAVVDVGEVNIFCGDPVIIVELRQRRVRDLLRGVTCGLNSEALIK